MFNRRFRRKIRIGAQAAADNRPKLIKTIVICTLCLALVIVLSVLLGNHLRNKADKADDLLSSTDTTTPVNPDGVQSPVDLPYDPVSVPTIKADYVTLSSSAGIDWSTRISSLKADGTTAVSLVLYYGDSVVNYSSAVAQGMGLQSATNTKTDLYSAMGMLRVAGIYTAGCFYPTFQNKTNPAVSHVFREYEAALIAEACSSDFLEVTVFGMGCDENAHLRTEQLFDSVRQLDPTATLGVALPAELLELSERQLVIDNFSFVADYLALDLSTCQTAEQLTAALDDAASLIKKYNLRIIVSNTLAEAPEILAAAGCINWQKVPD